MPLKLYDAAHSPYAARVRIQAYAKNIPLQRVDPPGFRTPAFQQINPTGKIPALDTGTRVLPESIVIMEYLEERFPEPALLPSDLEARAVTKLFLRFSDVYIQPALFPLFREVMLRSGDSSALPAQVQNLREQVNLLDRLILEYDRSEHMQLDLADCALAPTLYFARVVPGWLGIKEDVLSDSPKVQAWWDWVRVQPPVATVFAEIDEGLRAFFARIQGQQQQ